MNTNTLSQRLAEGRIPVTDALRFAMQIADALRQLHDSGRVHGSVSPVSIAIQNNAVELMPAMSAAGATTPYTAPEVMAGSPADTRSDIFSFGTVVYEMLTGKRAFEGGDRSKPAPSGSPAVDRFVAGCTATEPAARLQNIKRVMMELKLLNAAARRAEPTAARSNAAESAVRAEMQQLEARIGTKLQEQQKFVAEMQHVVTDAVATLRGQLASVTAELATSRERSSHVEQSIEAAGERVVTRVQQSVDAVSERVAAVQLGMEATSVRIAALEQGHASVHNRIADLEQKETPAPVVEIPAHIHEGLTSAGNRIASLESALEGHKSQIHALASQPAAAQIDPEVLHNVTAISDRVGHLEQAVETLTKRTSELHESIAQDLEAVEKNLQTQSASIESTRTAMAQTDDLVERVVEALESLQTIVLEQSDRSTTLG